MCGIIGITQNNPENLMEKLYQSLKRLEYRGYDSVGFAVLSKENIKISKNRGKVDEVAKQTDFSLMKGTTGIGHSRWATHGAPTKENAHPHTDCQNRIAVVHNGIISNFLQLRRELTQKGHIFTSETDTEVVPHLLEDLLQQGKTMKEALFELATVLGGAYALVVVHTSEPSKIYCMKKENPLILGITKDESYAASDIPAFLPYTREAITLRDDELAILEPGKYLIFNVRTRKPVNRKPHRITWTPDAAQKGGFPHFMLKEIHESGQVLRTQLASEIPDIERIVQAILDADNIITMAAGTAFYASLTAQYLFQQDFGKIVIPTIAPEYETVLPIINENTVVIAVSQSGETIDTIKAVKEAKQKGAKIIAIVNVVGSTITRIADHVVYIQAGPEIGVAATKTYLAQVFAIWRIHHQALITTNQTTLAQQLQEAIQTVPDEIERIVRNDEAKAREIAKKIQHAQSAFYLGRGINLTTALEGALKLKEISYIHAEAYPAGESKHGPIALIQQNYPIIFIAPNDNTREKIIGNIMEMKARGAYTIGIIEKDDNELKQILHQHFEINPKYSKHLQNIPYQIPLHLIAYYTATIKGHDPDYPRNLAKSVTVE